MKLYIQIENDIAINHPAFEDNLLDAFGSIPKNWVKFTRIEQPSPDILPVGIYQVATCKYILDDDGVSWKDEWSVRDMTDYEKLEKINCVKKTQPYASWIFDEESCSFLPPVPFPEIGQWSWDEEKQTWIEFIPKQVQLSDVSF